MSSTLVWSMTICKVLLGTLVQVYKDRKCSSCASINRDASCKKMSPLGVTQVPTLEKEHVPKNSARIFGWEPTELDGAECQLRGERGAPSGMLGRSRDPLNMCGERISKPTCQDRRDARPGLPLLRAWDSACP
jgi:hypothetical protein